MFSAMDVLFVIIGVVCAVHLVSRAQFKVGFMAGRYKGRQEILQENLARTEKERFDFESEIVGIVNQLESEQKRLYLNGVEPKRLYLSEVEPRRLCMNGGDPDGI